MIRAALCALILGAPASAQIALELPIGSVETARTIEAPGQYRLPVGRFTIEHQPALALEGRIITRAWRIPGEGVDTLALLRLLKPQLLATGYSTIFECDTTGCGGFDYRFNTAVLPPPEMEFDLRDFRVLTAERQGEAPAYLSLLISQSGRGGFVQAIDVLPAPPEDTPLSSPEVTAQPQTATTNEPEAILQQLDSTGRLILATIRFPAGARDLDEAAVASLRPLADALSARSDLQVVLVGHTDNAGTLAANINLSRSRAQAVRRVLVDRYGIAGERIGAEGAGFLSPLYPNTTDENRAANRRVEVILR